MSQPISRRHFAITAALAAVAPAALATKKSANNPYTDGVEYISLPYQVATRAAKGKVEVVEFFSYLCIHCYNLEPKFQAWKKSADKVLDIKKVHIAFDERTAVMQKMFYTLKSLGLQEKYHQAILDTTFVKKQAIKSDNDIIQWCVAHGINASEVAMFMGSFSVANDRKMADKLTNDYGVDATPTMGVAGQFFIPAQGERMFAVAEYLAKDFR